MTNPLDEGTPVRADVPLDLHPDSLLGLGPVLNRPDTLGLSVLSAAREALRLCYDCFGCLNDAERDLQAAAEPALRRQHPADKGGRTEVTGNVRMVNGKPTRIVDTAEFIDAAEASFKRVAPAVDRRVTELKGYRETLAGRVAAALDTPARKSPEGLVLAGEVRAHIKAIKNPTERSRLVMQAIEDGDLPTVAAVIHAPPFLSGLEPGMHAAVRARAASKFAPVDHLQLEATDTALDRVMHAGSALTARYGKVLALREAPLLKAAKSVKALAEG